jgi:ribosomal protein S27AE
MDEQKVGEYLGGALAKSEAGSGAMALALMSEEAFTARLAMVTRAQERVRALVKAIMVDGEDFGTIPGTKKPTLLKPGAETLAAFYGLIAVYEHTTTYGDGVTRPWITVEVKTFMHLGAADGPIVGEGLGSANSSEAKHKYRTAKRTCPQCGSVGAIGRSKYEDKDTGEKGWWCRDCRTDFALADPAIVDQQLGMVENPDPSDVENTCLKMAKKRSFIDGTLTTTATSGFFTQDLEDKGDDGRKVEATSHDSPARGDVVDAERVQPEREPGPGASSGGGPEQDPYAKHGVEPPRERPAARSAATRGPARGDKAPCPQCGKPAFPSKYPDKGSHYCGLCGLAFDAQGARR